MTVHLDYSTFFESVPHLTLEESLGGYFTAIDQHGRIYTPPSLDMNPVIRQMRAMAIRGHATLDEESITWFRALRQFGDFSVRADAFKSERGTDGGADSLRVPVTSAAVNEPTSPLSEIGVVAALPQGAEAAGDKAAAPMHLRLVN